MNTIIFAIETSCDETSVAIINDNREIISHITINQKNHHKFGGIVPEIAARSHTQILQSIIPQSLKLANLEMKNIDVFCATCGPGLIGSLLIGSTIAKSLSIGTNKPFYPINHLEGHLLSTEFISEIDFPNLTLLITGGHTQIYLIKSHGNYELLGETIDDSIGECFDKVAKLIGLGYPGGPIIEKIAYNGNHDKFELPHPLKDNKNFNFSFSGIKTAVRLLAKKQNKLNSKVKNDIAASFQKKIIEILSHRLEQVMKYLQSKKYNIKYISVVGGVAANKKIIQSLKKIGKKYNCRLVYPPVELCGDNAAMIANACLYKVRSNIKPDINFKPDPRLTIEKMKK